VLSSPVAPRASALTLHEMVEYTRHMAAGPAAHT